jgi:TolB protein
MLSFHHLTAQDKTPYNGMPDWSPDGKSIVFVSTRAGSHDIWLMNADGTNPINLTPDFKNFIELFPKWSPDGKSLLFISVQRGKSDIFSIKMSDFKPLNLTAEFKNDVGHPKWSPDGIFIAFGAFETRIQANFSESRKLTEC